MNRRFSPTANCLSILIFAAFVLLSACENSSPTEKNITASQGPVGPPPPPGANGSLATESSPAATAESTSARSSKVAPTKAEAADFALSLESAVRDGNTAAASALIDWDAIVARATEGLELQPSFRNRIRAGLAGDNSTGTIAQITASVQQGGGYTLLRVHTVNGERRALFRLLQSDLSKNYHDLVIQRRDDGELQAVDIYVFLAGDMLSAIIRRRALAAIAQSSQNLLASLASDESEYIEHLPEISNINKLVREGDGAKAIEIYSGLPADLRHEKCSMLIYLQAAQIVGGDEYLRCVEAFKRQHPEDPALAMMMTGYYLGMEQYDQALEAIDQLESMVGSDPFLEFERAAIYFDQGKSDLGRQAAWRAVNAEPTLAVPYPLLLADSLERRDFRELVDVLNMLQSYKITDLETMLSHPAYTEFVESPEYEQWKAAAEVDDQ